MRFGIKKIEAAEWIDTFSELAHRAVFNEHKPKERDRIDFALLAYTADVPIGYMTCREFDNETIYWQFGGSFPPIRSTLTATRVYESFVRWHQEHYKRCVTYIENDNRAMLGMAARVGFKITGIRNYQGAVLLEHLLEF